MHYTERFSTIQFAAKEKFSAFREKIPFITVPRYKRWDSAAYFQTEKISSSEAIHQTGRELGLDLLSFFHEYVGFLAKKTYAYGPQGIVDPTFGSYEQTISQICQKHELKLAAEAKKLTRAQLETAVAKTVEQWMTNPKILPGAKIISVSPRGSLDEGYPGQNPENWIFVNLYTKIDQNKHLFTQYLGFSSEQELAAFQATIRNLDRVIEKKLAIQDVVSSNLSHQIIADLLFLPPTINFETVEQLLYQHKDRWPKKVDDLPQFDTALFSFNLKKIIAALQAEYLRLTNTNDPTKARLDFDLLIDTVARKYFLVWVQDHAKNYQRLLGQHQKMTPDVLDLETMFENYRLLVKKHDQENLSTLEHKQIKQWQKVTTLAATTPLFRFASLAHCVAGTPSSLALRGLNLSFGMGGASMPLSHLSGLEVQKFSSSEKRRLQDTLAQLTRITVENKATGATEIFYIMVANPQDALGYQKGCYRNSHTGPIIGPCAIALEADPLIIAQENGQKMIYDEAKYYELMRAALSTELMAVFEKNDSTEQEKAYLTLLVNLLTRSLFKVSLSSFVAGVTEYHNTLFQLPKEILKLVTNSPQPLKALEQIVIQLDPQSLSDLEDRVLYEKTHIPALQDNPFPRYNQTVWQMTTTNPSNQRQTPLMKQAA